MVYLILLIAMIICCYFCKDEKSNRKAFLIFSLILTLLLMFRYGQGTDYFNYEYIFKNVNSINSPLLSGGDIGFKFLIVISKKLGFDFVMFNAIISIITMVLMIRGIDVLSKNKLLSLTIFYPLYFIVYPFSAIRQGLAMAIFIGILLKWLIDKKYIKYCIGVIIASTFHMSAIFLLGLVIVRYIDMVRMRNFIALLTALLLFKLLGIQTILLSFLPESISARASTYLTGDISISALGLRIIFMVGIYYLYYKASEEVKNENKVIMNIYIAGFFIYVFFMNSPLISSRLSAYIKIVEIILIANFMSISIKSISEVIKFSLLSLFLYVLFVKNITALIYQGDYYSHISITDYPYVSIFDKENIYTYRDLENNIHININYDKYQWTIRPPKNFDDLPD